jgi:hypothetical protein
MAATAPGAASTAEPSKAARPSVMARFSIRTRLIVLAAVLLAALIGSNAYLSRELSENAQTLAEEAEIVSTLTTAHAASRAFGDLKYWLTDLAVSLAALLHDPSAPVARDTLYWHLPHYHHSTPASAIRRGDWKLIEFFEDGSLELYNLREDLGEKENLAARKPEKARELREALAAWRKEVGAQMPRPNPDFDPERANELARRNREGSRREGFVRWVCFGPVQSSTAVSEDPSPGPALAPDPDLAPDLAVREPDPKGGTPARSGPRRCPSSSRSHRTRRPRRSRSAPDPG